MVYHDRDDSDDSDDDLDISVNRGGRAKHVPNYLILAILITICCWPLGLPAIIFAARVNGLVARGEYDAARFSSRVAMILCFVSIFVILAGAFLWCFVAVIQPNGF